MPGRRTRTTPPTRAGALALAAALMSGAVGATVLYDAQHHLAGITGVPMTLVNDERRWFDIRFVHGTYAEAYGAGWTQLPAGWPFDWQTGLTAWSALVRELDRQGADGVPFAGDQQRAYLPWLNTGIQLGYPCSMCLRSYYGYYVPTRDEWTFGGLQWVRSAGSARYPADAAGPVVTWIVPTPAAPVPEPGTAGLALAGTAGLAAWARRRRRVPLQG